MSVETALKELMSPRLKLVVYFVITWAYAYADLFTGQIGYVIRLPKEMPVRNLHDHSITLMKRKVACQYTHGKSTEYEVILDDSFNHSDHYHNPVTHLHMQCNNWPITMAFMGVFIMNWFGQIIFNGLGDRIGRKPIVASGMVIGSAVYILICLPYDFTLFVVYALVLGFGLAYFIQAFVMASEMTHEGNREWFMICCHLTIDLFLLLPTTILTFQNYLEPYFIAVAILGVLITVSIFFLPESPRQCFVTGKEEKARAVFVRFARWTKDEELVKKYQVV